MVWQLIWSFLALFAVLAGFLGVMVAQSDIQYIFSACAFTCAAACGTNALLSMLLPALRRSVAVENPTSPESTLPVPIDNSDVLKSILDELRWQRLQKEKELHRAKAASTQK